MKPVIFALCVVALFAKGCFLFPDKKATGEGWKVWVKTSPCPGGRTDWVSVAKENPSFGGGGGSWSSGDLIVSPLPCTGGDNSCSFETANKNADKIRSSDRFLNYCCKDYLVWENTESKEKSIVKGANSAGYGWIQVDSGLCCEEAEEISGKSGSCGGNVADTRTQTRAGRTGFVGCFKDTNDFDLKGFLERSDSNTPERCVATCRAKGFAYAGVQYSVSCLCGNSYGKYGPAENCDYPCSGDRSKMCGGYSTNSVYGTGVAPPE